MGGLFSWIAELAGWWWSRVMVVWEAFLAAWHRSMRFYHYLGKLFMGFWALWGATAVSVYMSVTTVVNSSLEKWHELSDEADAALSGSGGSTFVVSASGKVLEFLEWVNFYIPVSELFGFATLIFAISVACVVLKVAVTMINRLMVMAK